MLFTFTDIKRLTGLDKGSIHHLIKLNVIQPKLCTIDGGIRKIYKYTWEDLIELRLIASWPNVRASQILQLKNFLKEHSEDDRLHTANILYLGNGEFYLIEETEDGDKLLIDCMKKVRQLCIDAILLPNPIQKISKIDSKIVQLYEGSCKIA